MCPGPFTKYAAFIPLRAGSRGIPRKNIRALGGKPLCFWVIEAALACPQLGKVYVSTDGEEIAQLLKLRFRTPRLEVIGRSEASATDTAPTEIALLEFAQQYPFETVVLLQATSPLTTPAEISQAIRIFEEGGFDSLLSAVPQKRFLWTQTQSGALPTNYSPATRPRRQDQTPFFVENGALYISTKTALLASNCRLSGRIGIYPMNMDSFFELDEPEDFEFLEKLVHFEKAA